MADADKKLEQLLEQVPAEFRRSPEEMAAMKRHLEDCQGEPPASPAELARTARSKMAHALSAVEGRILSEIAGMRQRNRHTPGDGEAVTVSKAAALAMCDMLEHAARQGVGGVRYQRDMAYCLGQIFGAVVRARGLSRGGSAMSVEDLAADFGSGAARAAFERR